MTNFRNVVIGVIVSALVAGVVVSCGGGGGYGGGSTAVTYTVGGTLSGATGTVTLKLNGGSDISTANASFTFAGGVANGNPFNVQVVAANQRCTVANGAGTMGAANITNVAVTCGAQAAQMVIRSAILTGATQNPPVTTAATGVGGIVYNPTTNDITGGITFSGLTPTAGNYHIHQAPIGDPTNNGPVIIGLVLAADGKTAVVPPGTKLTVQAQIDALMAGELYFNVHTVANPVGEIRGQINLQGGVLASAVSLNAAQEVPAGTSTATGTGTVIMDAATRTLLITYITHNVANASAGHIHTSPSGPGSTGGVIVGFDTLTANFDGAGNNIAYPPAGSQLPSANLGDFLSNYLYFNVHSGNNLCPPAADCSLGEIRGNITVQ